jgi:hypothetical protein
LRSRPSRLIVDLTLHQPLRLLARRCHQIVQFRNNFG